MQQTRNLKKEKKKSIKQQSIKKGKAVKAKITAVHGENSPSQK